MSSGLEDGGRVIQARFCDDTGLRFAQFQSQIGIRRYSLRALLCEETRLLATVVVSRRFRLREH